MNSKSIIKQLAKIHKKSEDEILKEIENAIKIGMENNDVQVQKFWSSIHSKNEVPTPYELIDFITKNAV